MAAGYLSQGEAGEEGKRPAPAGLGAVSNGMYLLYVDESGDTGRKPGSSRYFVLSGFVVHELRWHQTLNSILGFRRELRNKYNLKLRHEIHAGEFVQGRINKVGISRSIRLRILREILDFEASLPDVSLLNVLVEKAGKPVDYPVFENAWRAMIQRFHNTISYRNFPGPANPDERGILLVDQTEEARLRRLTRRLGVYNPVPNLGGGGYRMIPITTLIEDAVHRNSLHSLFLQLCDVNAYFLTQQERPIKYLRTKGGRNYFKRLNPILCKVASKPDPQGIVRL